MSRTPRPTLESLPRITNDGQSRTRTVVVTPEGSSAYDNRAYLSGIPFEHIMANHATPLPVQLYPIASLGTRDSNLAWVSSRYKLTTHNLAQGDAWHGHSRLLTELPELSHHNNHTCQGTLNIGKTASAPQELFEPVRPQPWIQPDAYASAGSDRTGI